MGPEYYTVFSFASISVGLSRAPVAETKKRVILKQRAWAKKHLKDSDMSPGLSYIKMFSVIQYEASYHTNKMHSVSASILIKKITCEPFG